MPYVSNRWLGGLLTNWRTISERIAYLHDLRRLQTEGQLELLPSKERIALTGELEKLEANLGGVADMKRQPDAVFVIDLKKEQLAVREARRLGVPIVGLVDTNADPGRGRLRHPRKRRRHPCVEPDREGRRRRHRRRPGPGHAGRVRSGAGRGGADRRRRRRQTEGSGVQPDPGRRRRSPRPRGRRAKAARPNEHDDRASLVKELRDQTGAGMMDCKRALEETGGDLEAARTLLRERGMASAGKRAGRSTTEGLVGYIVEGPARHDARASAARREPVSKNDEFQSCSPRAC